VCVEKKESLKWGGSICWWRPGQRNEETATASTTLPYAPFLLKRVYLIFPQGALPKHM
jgi:hypothetical protein